MGAQIISAQPLAGMNGTSPRSSLARWAYRLPCLCLTLCSRSEHTDEIHPVEILRTVRSRIHFRRKVLPRLVRAQVISF